LSIQSPYLRLGRALIGALTLATMLANSQRAFAWKPKTHAHLAEVAYRDAVDDGLVTIYATDYQRGVIRRLRGNNNKVVIGTYRVYPPMLDRQLDRRHRERSRHPGTKAGHRGSEEEPVRLRAQECPRHVDR